MPHALHACGRSAPTPRRGTACTVLQVLTLLPGRPDIPINDLHTPVAFESELFSGKLQVGLI